MRLMAYIRGGLGDVWIAISALKKICEDNKINKFDTYVVTDSVYYFRDYPKEMEQYSLDMIRKLTPNVMEVPPWLNDNFWLNKNGIRFDDTTNELSQEEADKYTNEFMFWRPNSLKRTFVHNLDDNTIFVDCLFAECVMMWDNIMHRYERVSNDRATFNFNPPEMERDIIDAFFNLCPKHLLLSVRKKNEGDAYTETDEYYQKIITWCNEKGITPMLIGVDDGEYEGSFSDMRGSNKFSFEGIGYLINKSKVLLGNDSFPSILKLYQQQKDTLLIMNHPRIERSVWCKKAMTKSNCLLLDAKEDNFDKITKAIGDYYESK